MKYKSFDDLPKCTDVKNKVKKSFSLSREAVEVYETAKAKGVNTTKIVEEKIEEVLKEVSQLLK
jgi:hypothetical protein